MYKKGQCWALTLIKRLGERRTPGPTDLLLRLDHFRVPGNIKIHISLPPIAAPSPLAALCVFGLRTGCVLDFWAKRQITFLFGFDVVAIATVIPFA